MRTPRSPNRGVRAPAPSPPLRKTLAATCWLFGILASFAAHAQSAPGAPHGLSAVPGDTQAVLNWTNPSDSSITSYQVRRGTSTPLVFNAWAAVSGSGATTVTATVTGLTNGTRYAFEVRAVNSVGNGAVARVSKTLAAAPSTAVTISDANLRALVETTLGVASGTTITQGDMAKLTHLVSPRSDFWATNVASLTGLSFALNLERLRLGGGTISSLAPLGTLTALTYLDLGRNSITDVSALGALTALTSLSLGDNSITDVSALGSLTALTSLGLWENSITDVSALGALTALTDLSLGGNSITDVSALGTLTALTRLRLWENSITDVSALGALTALTNLGLWSNSITDVSALGTLTALEYLELASNSITDISALVANSGLGAGDLLDLRVNPLDATALGTHIPALVARGVTVQYGDLVDDGDLLPPNQAPEITGTVEAASLEPGQRISLAGRDYFNDPDFDFLTFSVSSSNPAVVTASVGEQGAITVAAVAEGLAEVTLSATDPGGLSTSLSFMVTVGNPASLGGGAGELSAFASAPEGGVVELTISLAEPRDADVSLAWAIGVDDDPATADADVEDHGNASGTVVIPAGETGAAINIAIADDADIEPAREAFVVSLTPQDGVALGVASATVHIEEGVCDRTPQVADALRGARDCAAVTPAELEHRVAVRLTDAGLAELHPLDFLGMPGMTILRLDGNGLSALPSGLLSGSPGLQVLHLRGNRFEALPAEALRGLAILVELDLGGNLLRELPAAPFAESRELGYLHLDGNQIETVPADLIAGLRWLRFLKLQDNAIDALPDGFFAGIRRLWQLGLHGNPGAPFALDVGLVEDDAADDVDAEGAVSVRLAVPQGAPFDMAVPLTVDGGTLAADTATIAAGQTLGAPVEARQGEEGGAVTVSIASAPMLPAARCGHLDDEPCFRGVQMRLGEPLTLFDDPAPSMAVPTLRR